MLEPSDETLMHAVREGHVDQLGVLFERHYARVHALCYRLTRRADVADDLAQETMLRALRYRETFREQAALATWLYRLAYNVCQDYWRRSRRDDATKYVMDLIARHNDERVDERPDCDDDRHVLLEQALTRLSPDHRAVLVLSRYHDLSYDDIARVLDPRAAPRQRFGWIDVSETQRRHER